MIWSIFPTATTRLELFSLLRVVEQCREDFKIDHSLRVQNNIGVSRTVSVMSIVQTNVMTFHSRSTFVGSHRALLSLDLTEHCPWVFGKRGQMDLHKLRFSLTSFKFQRSFRSQTASRFLQQRRLTAGMPAFPFLSLLELSFNCN